MVNAAREGAQSGKTLVEARGNADVTIVPYTWRKGAKDKPTNLTAGSLVSFPQVN